jgi:predicted metalloprotease with PDZ domain
MSTAIQKFSIYFFICMTLLVLNLPVSAQQTIEARIKFDAARPKSLSIEGEFLQINPAAQSRNWSFLNNATSAENLAERIVDFNLADEKGRQIPIKKFAAGEYLAEKPAAFWTYLIEIGKPQNVNNLAHISWLDEEQGILMLDDLLPQFSSNPNHPIAARIKFDLPSGWKIISREKQTTPNVFEVESVEKAVFIIGKNWREREILVEGGKLNFVISDNWQFSDDEAEKTAADIFAEYKKLFGEVPNKNIQISLIRFPKETKFGRWQAETRGANLTILSSDMPFKTPALQRLHEQLRHELFHLWMPNNLALTGNYDWFYEGFTVYQALKTGVKMNQIRFEDFLDTLAQAYNLDNFQTQKFSLSDASKNLRSGAGNSQVYARGMLVAFLCDAALLRESKGRRSIANVFRQVYQKHRKPNAPQEGNAAVLNILGDYKELNPTIEKYVKGTGKIDWKTDLESLGIEQANENEFVRLKVRAKPSRREKDLLDKLGYNNWRKISEKTK